MSTPTLTVLTPPGRGGVASVRLDGHESLPSPLRDARGRSVAWPPPGRVRHLRWHPEGGPGVIDECVVVGAPGGVEVHLHGGSGVLARLASSLGLVPCREEVWAPRGPRALRAAASARWGWMAETCVAACRAVESGRVSPEVRARVEQALDHEILGRRLARPARIRLAGRPNAGKSSLFNALLAESRALVSPHPGTTRDSVVAPWMLAGVEVLLEDTAGRFEPQDGDDVDLVLAVRGPADRALSLPLAPEVVRVGTHGDRPGVRALPGELLVSGPARIGLDALGTALEQALGLGGEAQADVRAPLDDATCRLLRAVLELPHGADRGAG